jgi:hypothetical protein
MEQKKNWREALREKYNEQAVAWKRQHGTVKVLFVEDSKESGRALFFRMPTRLQFVASEAVSISAGSGEVDVYKKSERLLVDCLLGGDISLEEILNDTSLFISVSKFVLCELIDQKKTSWENC